MSDAIKKIRAALAKAEPQDGYVMIAIADMAIFLGIAEAAQKVAAADAYSTWDIDIKRLIAALAKLEAP